MLAAAHPSKRQEGEPEARGRSQDQRSPRGADGPDPLQYDFYSDRYSGRRSDSCWPAAANGDTQQFNTLKTKLPMIEKSVQDKVLRGTCMHCLPRPHDLIRLVSPTHRGDTIVDVV